MLAMLMLQAVSGPIDLRPRAPRPVSDAPCPPPDPSGDVVVCGRRGDSPYRLKPLPPRATEPALPVAEVKLPGGGTVAAHGEEGNVGGFHTNRAMVSLKLPF